MNDLAQIYNLDSLTALLEREPINIRWTIYPHEPSVIWLAPSALHLSTAQEDVPETAFSHQFKQFISNTIGLKSHTRGTTQTASGKISLVREFSRHSIEIEVSYYESPESPEIESYCDSGTSSVYTSLEDFTLFLESTG